MNKNNGSLIPQQTVEIAKAAFPKGNVYMTIRDCLGEIYKEQEFEELFKSNYGRPHLSPLSISFSNRHAICRRVIR